MGAADGFRSLDSILNSSTPFAPVDEDDARSRIGAAQAPAPEPGQGSADEQDEAGGWSQAPDPAEAPPATARVDFSDSRELVNEDRVFQGLSAASALARVRAEQAEQLLQEQRRRVFSAASPDGRVRASVDGTGRLLSLEIDDALLRGSEARLSGQKVVEAVTAATMQSIKEFSVPDWSTF